MDSKILSINLGACAMTTKFLDYTICTFEILLSWRFPEKKQRFWTVHLSTPTPNPLKMQIFLCCRLAVSDSSKGFMCVLRANL